MNSELVAGLNASEVPPNPNCALSIWNWSMRLLSGNVPSGTRNAPSKTRFAGCTSGAVVGSPGGGGGGGGGAFTVMPTTADLVVAPASSVAITYRVCAPTGALHAMLYEDPSATSGADLTPTEIASAKNSTLATARSSVAFAVNTIAAGSAV